MKQLHPAIAAELGIAAFRKVRPAHPSQETDPVPAASALPAAFSEDPAALAAAPLLPGKKPRNGKIARLPKPIRDLVGRMLFKNISQEIIADALDDLGIHVTRRNISNWRTRGGYREWCLAQEHALNLRLAQDQLVDLVRRHDAGDVSEAGLQVAATQLSQFLLTPAARELLVGNPREYERHVAMLARISAQLTAIQQHRDQAARDLGSAYNPEKIRRKTEHELESLQQSFTATYPEGEDYPQIPHRNELPDPTKLLHLNSAPQEPSRSSDLVELLQLMGKSRPANSADRSPLAPGPNATV